MTGTKGACKSAEGGGGTLWSMILGGTGSAMENRGSARLAKVLRKDSMGFFCTALYSSRHTSPAPPGRRSASVSVSQAVRVSQSEPDSRRPFQCQGRQGGGEVTCSQSGSAPVCVTLR